MTAIQWNCRGYRKNYGDITTLLHDYQPFFCVLQETMLGDYSPRPPSRYNIITHSTQPEPRPGTGLATLIRQDLSFRKINVNTTLQALAVMVNWENKQYTICNIYIAPGEAITAASLLNLLNQLNRPFLILGDFNAKSTLWGNETNDIHGRIIEQLLRTTDCCLLNTGDKTHFHTQTGTSSAIDLSLCSPDTYAETGWRALMDTHGSDHYPIVLSFTRGAPQELEPRLVMKHAKWKLYEISTRMQNTEDDDETNSDVLLRRLTKVIETASRIAIPRTTGGTVGHRFSWWNEECNLAITERKRALRRYQRSKAMVDKISFNRARARATKVQNEARKASWQQYTSTLTSDTPIGKVFKRIKKIEGKDRPHLPCLVHGGRTVSDPQGVATELAEMFADISSGQHYTRRFENLKRQREAMELDFTSENAETYNDNITRREVNAALKKSGNSAPGPDGVYYEMLRNLHPSAMRVLLALFNKIWCHQQYPRVWRMATVLAFPKPGKPPEDRTSYRPIALTSCIGKLLERVVKTRLERHLETREILSPIQYGFRSCRSTTDALVRLQNHILENKRAKRHSICIFFDLHRAYDTTWRRGILQSLYDIGLRGNLPMYIRDFLSLRQFKVKVGKAYSPTQVQREGVPQGSVLSCTLFLLALNGIQSAIPENVFSSLYVDDLMICATSSYLPALTRRLQGTINRVSNWAIDNGFTFSAQKTVALHIRPSRSRDASPNLMLQERQVQYATSARFLGMLIDNQLTWKPHIMALRDSCMKKLNILKCIAGRTWGADRLTLLRIYRALVRSRIDYGCIVYQAGAHRVVSKLDTVHNAAIRLCTGAFRTSPVASLYVESAEPSLQYRRALLSFQFIARIKQLPLSPTWRSMFAARFRDQQLCFLPSHVDYTEMSNRIGLPRLDILPVMYHDEPTWRTPEEVTCRKGTYPGKTEISHTALRALFLEHVQNEHADDLHIFTDGSKSEEGTGCAAVSPMGVVSRKLKPECSIFTAELYAVADALRLASEDPRERFTIFCDSQSVIEAVGHYDSRHPIIEEITRALLQISETKRIRICWVPGHVGVSGNERADMEAKRASNTEGPPWNAAIPCKDYYPIIKMVMRREWQRQWNDVAENKLRGIKEVVQPWASSYRKSRRDEILLCRLRIGHTQLTHSFLLRNQHAPYCDDCIVPLTVQHVLAECPTFEEARRRYFPGSPNEDPPRILKRMLSETDMGYNRMDALKSFLEETETTNLI